MTHNISAIGGVKTKFKKLNGMSDSESHFEKYYSDCELEEPNKYRRQI